jgi:hypothetical protein
MRILFLSLLFSLLLFANNPKPFSALGDVIYENASKIEKLKNIDDFRQYEKKINDYVASVNATKKDGFRLEKSPKADLGKKYLYQLRKLAQTNDYFIHLVKVTYAKAKKEQNSELFSQIINSGLIDTKSRKKEIIDYYFKHQNDMNSTGVIQSFLDEDAKLRAKKEAQRKRYKSKKEREQERIRMIREHDKLERERLEKKLQEELNKKKMEIREYQKEELTKTI